jgi:hypothetical protein
MDQYLEAHRAQGARTQEQAGRSDLRRGIIRDMRIGNTEEAHQKLSAALSAGQLSKSDLAYIHKESKLEPLVAEFTGLRVDEALKVWELATPQERQQLRPLLIKKSRNLKTIPLDEQPIIRERFRKALSEAA